MLVQKCQELDGGIVEEQWSEWKESVTQTATTILGYKKGREEEWISSTTWDLIQEKIRFENGDRNFSRRNAVPL